MRLESLQISNLWCYERAEIEFEEGVTVIAGPNGSGKSSLLESIFFALYGSKAGPAMDRALADVLRLGAEKGSVLLAFRYGEQRYSVQMALRRRRDGTVISDKEACRLARDDGTEWVGVEPIAGAIEELFGMNRDDFTNCIYVRQGEIDRLIRAGEEERRRMIDRLLRLEKLDRYAQRAREGARRALHRKLDVLRSRAGDLQREIEALEKENLEQARAKIDEELGTLQEKLDRVDEKIAQVEAKKLHLQEQLQRMEETLREIHKGEEELARKGRRLQDHEKTKRELEAELDDLKQHYKKFEKQLAGKLAPLGLAEMKGAIVNSIKGAARWEEVERLPQELIRVKEEQDALRRRMQTHQAELTREIEKLTAEREAHLTALVEQKTQREHIERELGEMSVLIEQGRCPTCRQPVSAETFGEALQKKEEWLRRLCTQIEQQEQALQKLDERLQALKSEGENNLKRLDAEFQSLEAKRSGLEAMKDLVRSLLQIKEQGQEKRNLLKATVESAEALRDEFSRRQAEIAGKKRELGDADRLQVQIGQIQGILRKLDEQRKRVQREADALREERGKIEHKIEERAKSRKERERTDRELRRIEALQGELAQLTELYGSVKRELRTRNIRALEAYFNRFFALMDSGASYRGVRVSDEYEINVELKDGSAIRPELLSGGERALINIALRSAIHQVLSQATSRMPLILDEPTIYLDRDRIQRLQFLLEELGKRVGQVIVVSHELGLVEGADHEYRTEKQANNTSRVQRVR
jgi:exonuclease SbcC